MQLLRSILSDPALTYHLFTAYDMAVERKLDAVQVGGVDRKEGGRVAHSTDGCRPHSRCAPPTAQPRLKPFLHSRAAAVQSLCKAAVEVIDATLAAAASRDPEDEPPLDVVAALYSDKTAGGLGLAGRVQATAGRHSGQPATSGAACLAPATTQSHHRLLPPLSVPAQARTGAWMWSLRARRRTCSAAT